MSRLILYTAGTPNGHKVTAYLEELKAAGLIPGYDVKALSFAKNEQKEDWFLKINPNGRIPALVDPNRNGGQRVFESASILFYLAKYYDTKGLFSFPDDDVAETELYSWIFWGHGGVGPMQGQANHFVRYAPEDIPYGKKRYVNETRRLYETLDTHLVGREYVVGAGKGKYSIADMSMAPWIRGGAVWSGIPVDGLDNLKAWLDRIEARPAFKAAVNIPDEDKISYYRDHPEEAAAAAKSVASWIIKGNEPTKK